MTRLRKNIPARVWVDESETQEVRGRKGEERNAYFRHRSSFARSKSISFNSNHKNAAQNCIRLPTRSAAQKLLIWNRIRGETCTLHGPQRREKQTQQQVAHLRSKAFALKTSPCSLEWKSLAIIHWNLCALFANNSRWKIIIIYFSFLLGRLPAIYNKIVRSVSRRQIGKRSWTFLVGRLLFQFDSRCDKIKTAARRRKDKKEEFQLNYTINLLLYNTKRKWACFMIALGYVCATENSRRNTGKRNIYRESCVSRRSISSEP